MKKKVVLFGFILLSVGCIIAAFIIRKPLNIVVIGNSITNHPVDTELGWFRNCGMAATAAENDFCGILSKNNAVQKITVEDWEALYNNSYFPPTPSEKTDVLIVQMGENVATNDFLKYRQALGDLILRYKQKDTRVMLVGNFWPVPEKDALEKKICEDNGYTFIDISEIQGNKAYQAQEQKNKDVANHPNDKGMEFIAGKIEEKL